MVTMTSACASTGYGPTADYDDVYGYKLHAAEAELARIRLTKCTR